MPITNDTLIKLSTLARLDITDAQMVPLKEKLASILTMVETITEIDTDSITPLSHPLDALQPLRDDICQKNLIKKDIQSLSDSIDNDLYIVPKVID